MDDFTRNDKVSLTLGEFILIHRKRQHLRKKILAKKAGVSLLKLNFVEANNYLLISIGDLIRICEELGFAINIKLVPKDEKQIQSQPQPLTQDDN
jgi:transcriptional regulator with XRE-family HTH domain